MSPRIVYARDLHVPKIELCPRLHSAQELHAIEAALFPRIALFFNCICAQRLHVPADYVIARAWDWIVPKRCMCLIWHSAQILHCARNYLYSKGFILQKHIFHGLWTSYHDLRIWFMLNMIQRCHSLKLSFFISRRQHFHNPRIYFLHIMSLDIIA